MGNEFDLSIGYVIGSTRRVILRELGAAFADNQIPLTMEQFIFLHTLKHMGEDVTQQDVANQICKDKSAVLRIIDTLEEKGLVERHQLSEDRRKNILTITPLCEDLFNRISEIEKVMMEKLTRGIDRRDYETAIRVLNSIQQNTTNQPANK